MTTLLAFLAFILLGAALLDLLDRLAGPPQGTDDTAAQAYNETGEWWA